MRKRTEVALTVDTEFSIGGAFGDFSKYKPIAERVVDCPVNGRSEGLGFVLKTFEQHGIKATFFVEALNYRYFGDAPMAGICRRLVEAGHDIQLHLHPCWMAFDGGALISDQPNDSCSGRSLEAMIDLIQRGLDAFGRWGLPRPVAFRTGNLVADTVVYQALNRLGIHIASNVGLGVTRPLEPRLQVASGRHLIHDVMEIPVTTFEDYRIFGRTNLRPLQITACSWQETRHVLWAARHAGLDQVVIMTHPFEYVWPSTSRYDKISINWINQRRLRKICRFLRDHQSDFAAVTFGDRAADWAAAGPQGEALLQSTTWRMLVRAAESRLMRRYWAPRIAG